jgi:FlaA1/EpsC-like NDP-sugar epimerase
MGSTKRFAEMILQSYSEQLIEEGNKLRISVVRFGNVLGSSGSVVPLFEDQIRNGGPVTVTDPNIIRYFMTIEEASQLVIQSGAMGLNGEIFVLDMGKQIKIKQLAEDMINLSGMTLKSEEDPDGDIEIVYTGLRPGEKLYEELSLEDEFRKTDHPKIFRADEDSISLNELLEDLDFLEDALASFNSDQIMSVLSKRITGFNHNRKIIDGTLVF